MWLVVGLGNPGNAYDRTRHNIGFRVVDALAERAGVKLRRSWRVSAEMAEAGEARERHLLVKPRTFMNRSGLAVAPLLRRKGLAPSDLIVIVDDTELDAGQIRVRAKGSPGGHNGLKSIQASIGTDAYNRVRVGVGRKPPGEDMVAFVLGRFAPTEQRVMEEAVISAADAVQAIMTRGVDRAMNDFNR